MAQTAAAEKAKPEGETKKVVRLDFDNIEVKRMIVEAKKSGLLHVDELNKHLVIDGITAEEIEILYARLNEMGISVHDQRDEETLGPKTLARTSTTAVFGCIFVKWAWLSYSLVKARLRLRNVSKLVVTR